MATPYTIEVEFDRSDNGFKFSGDVLPGVSGQRLYVPYTTNLADPQEIRIKKKNPPVLWDFRTISFRGPTGSSLILVDSWRTVTQNEAFPLAVIDDSGVMKLEVQSVDDDEIVIKDTNLATQIDIGLRFQVTIFDTTDGRWWTSLDPQIINEKQTGV